MSAITLKADITVDPIKHPLSAITGSAALFDDLIGQRDHRRRDNDTELSLCGDLAFDIGDVPTGPLRQREDHQRARKSETERGRPFCAAPIR